MTRLLAGLVALGVLCGCKGQNAATPVDPFGRTRVAPPRTGCISGQPATDPYYPGTRQAVTPHGTLPQASSQGTPSANPPATGNWYAPPGDSYNYKGSSIDRPETLTAVGPGDRVAIPLDARTTPDWSEEVAGNQPGPSPTHVRGGVNGLTTEAAAPASAAATARSSAVPVDRTSLASAAEGFAGGLAGRERIVRTLEPRPRGAADLSPGGSHRGGITPAGSPPGRFGVPDGAIDIMDLPEARSTSGGSPPAFGPGGVRLVSGTDESANPSAVVFSAPQSESNRTGGVANSFSSRSNYGHGPNYEWLKGKLEYSEIDRRWKLRYIPIDGTTDEFGGSVVLSNTSVLAGHERGNFVEVHGRLVSNTGGDGGYAPDFELREIKPLGN